MPYWQLFYHLVWATKNRQPVIASTLEEVIYDMIRAKAIGLGATVYAVNGTVDHTHLVVAVPPSIAVAAFVGRVKGSSSSRYNKSSGLPDNLYWQNDYAAFSFEGRRLPQYIDYVRRQKEHHANGTAVAILERTEGEIIKHVQDDSEMYTFDDAEWRQELLAWYNDMKTRRNDYQ